MNDDASELTLSQKDIQNLNLSIEGLSEKEAFNDVQKRRVHELIRKEFSRKNNHTHLPTVRKMISVLNAQHIDPQTHTSKLHQNTTSNSQLISLQLSQSTQSNRTKKLKIISKLIALRKDVIQTIEQTNEHEDKTDIKQSIYDLIDEIQNTRNSNAFFSQPHYTKSESNDKKHGGTLRLLNKTSGDSMIQSGIHYISVPGPYKTIQSSRNSIQKNYHNKQLSKAKGDMNKLQAEKGYINTIWQLEMSRKFELQKKNLYHTIDPNKTEKWFKSDENSRKKLSHLFRDKEKLAEESKEKSLLKYRKNQLVSKLIQKSTQQYTALTNEVKELTQARDKGRSLILRDKSQTLVLRDRKEMDSLQYKVKQKQYFRIEMDKIPSPSKSTKAAVKQLNKILPPIKVNGAKVSI